MERSVCNKEDNKKRKERKTERKKNKSQERKTNRKKEQKEIRRPRLGACSGGAAPGILKVSSKGLRRSHRMASALEGVSVIARKFSVQWVQRLPCVCMRRSHRKGCRNCQAGLVLAAMCFGCRALASLLHGFRHCCPVLWPRGSETAASGLS